MTIYVVEGSTGEYSDHREWLVRAYADKSKAEAKVLRCDARARVANESLNDGDQYDNEKVRPFQDEDPHMDLDCTGTRYYVREVEYEP